MLSISQLAAVAGCTVKAVRVYHRRGLLPEPDRDAAGYRRYDAQAVIDLTRITTLARSGVPLADIPAVLAADGDTYAEAISRIDQDLARRAADITERRRRLQLLRTPDRLCLPEPVAARLDRLRGLGLSERALAAERDSWILARAVLPTFTEHYLPARLALLDDPEYVQLIRCFDEVVDLPADAPELDALVEATTALALRLSTPQEQQRWSGLPRQVLQVVATFRGHDSPAWASVLQRVDSRLAPSAAPEPADRSEGEAALGLPAGPPIG